MRLIFLNDLRRRRFIRWEIQKKLLKGFIKNSKTANSNRLFACFHKNRIPVFGTLTRHRNFCLISGRSNTVSRRFKLSRFELRNEGEFGNWAGLTKANW